MELGRFNGFIILGDSYISYDYFLLKFSPIPLACCSVGNPVGELVSIGKEAVAASRSVLDLYKKEADVAIPWDTIKEVAEKLDKFRNDYATRSGILAGDIKMLLENAMDEYFMSTQSIYEWCGIVITRLNTYLRLIKNPKSGKVKMQHSILIRLLENGLDKLTTAQDKLDQSSRSLNSASGKIIALSSQLNADFEEKSEFVQERTMLLKIAARNSKSCFLFICWDNSEVGDIYAIIQRIKSNLDKIKGFHEELKVTLGKATTDINSTKEKLREEIRVIGELKVKATVTKESLDDVIENYEDIEDEIAEYVGEPARDLIKECEQYRTRHGGASMSTQK